MRQNNQVELNLGTGASGEAASVAAQETEARAARTDIESQAVLVGPSMEAIVERDNLKKALTQVKCNKGAPGIDGMTVDDLAAYLKEHWPAIRVQLLDGTYEPQPVRRVEIPKASGGTRSLGIPTVLDRFVQQLLLQVLQPIFDPAFSEHSHGFRPGRRAHDAVREAQHYIRDGAEWVVDVDLEKFFDRVNHDVLMGKLQNRIGDPEMLRIIRRYLAAGIMADGVVTARHEGTPQGGPLSPLLANVLLDEVDKELERRGHRFVRYADDCNVYVQSKRAGEDVLAVLRQMYAELRLRINEEKSAVAPAWDRKFLGYSFWAARGEVKRGVAAEALEELKRNVRRITCRNGGRSMARVCSELGRYLRGWKEYFKLADTPGVFATLDGWIHRRLRALQLKQWKGGWTACRALRARGVPEWLVRKGSGFARRWWWAAALSATHTALPGTYFERLGVPRLVAPTSTH
mgnify:CR=1 FL=1